MDTRSRRTGNLLCVWLCGAFSGVDCMERTHHTSDVWESETVMMRHQQVGMSRNAGDDMIFHSKRDEAQATGTAQRKVRSERVAMEVTDQGTAKLIEDDSRIRSRGSFEDENRNMVVSSTADDVAQVREDSSASVVVSRVLTSLMEHLPLTLSGTLLEIGPMLPPPWGPAVGTFRPAFPRRAMSSEELDLAESFVDLSDPPSERKSAEMKQTQPADEPYAESYDYNSTSNSTNSTGETDAEARQRMAGSFVMNALIIIVFMALYNRAVVSSRKPSPSADELEPQLLLGEHGREKDFLHGTFSCFDDVHYCLHGCCCTVPRAADTAGQAGIYEFFTVAGIYYLFWCGSLGCDFLAKCTSGNSSMQYMLALVSFGFLVGDIAFRNHLRTKIRERYTKTAHHPVAFDCVDFLKVMCCFPCTTVQEARYVDHVASVRVECCCSFIPLAQRSPLLGQPVQSPPPAPVHAAAVPKAHVQALPVAAPPPQAAAVPEEAPARAPASAAAAPLAAAVAPDTNAAGNAASSTSAAPPADSNAT